MFLRVLGAAALLASNLAVGQPAPPGETYGSYLSAPAQENRTLQHGLEQTGDRWSPVP
jgi:hypothetical protein